MFDCICWTTPEQYHFVYYGITEPGSLWEQNPDCLQHPIANEVPVFATLSQKLNS